LQDLGEGFDNADAVHPPMKTKQIPDDFRDWIEARTFEIGAQIALPRPVALDYLMRPIIRQPAEGLPIGEVRP
jgi:hypothetical protein